MVSSWNIVDRDRGNLIWDTLMLIWDGGFLKNPRPKKEVDYGLFECILGWRFDLRPCPDSFGQDKVDARQDHGSLSMQRGCIRVLNIYPPFQEFAGAGASVPLLGFGNTLFKGVKEAVETDGFIGIFKGGFTASAIGISAALIFGYLASLVFEPKMKK